MLGDFELFANYGIPYVNYTIYEDLNRKTILFFIKYFIKHPLLIVLQVKQFVVQFFYRRLMFVNKAIYIKCNKNK